jgi:hypothetical protein
MLGGLLGGLFGGGEAEPAVTTQTTRPLPEYQQYFDELARGAQTAYKKQRKGPSPDIASGVAPFDPLQLKGQEGVLSAAGGPLQNFSNALLNAGTMSMTDFLRPDNPMVQNAIDAALNPMARQFTETVLPALEGEAVLSRNVGGSRQGVAEGLAADTLSRNMGEVAAGMSNEAYQAGLDQMMKAMALAPQTAQTGIFPQLAVSAVGEQRQQQDERERGGELAQDVFDYNKRSVALSNYANILSQLPGGVSQGVQQAAEGGGGGVGSAIGLGMQGFSLGSKLFPAMAAAGPVGAGIGIIAGLLG